MSKAMEARKVSAGQGWAWIRQGFELFRQNPGVWILILIMFMVLQGAANIIPLGGLAIALFTPALNAGILLGCRDLCAGQSLRFDHLFAAFRGERLGPLVLLGLLIMLLFGLIFAIGLGAGFILLGGDNIDPEQIEARIVAMFLLVFSVLLIPALLAVWFATPLVVLGGMGPGAALGASLNACMKNLGPLTLYGLILIPLTILAMIPLGLGLLVLAPTIMAAGYCSYADIFGDQAADRHTRGSGALIE